MKLSRKQIRQVILEEMNLLSENSEVRPNVAVAIFELTGLPLAAVAYGLSSSVREKMNSAFDQGEDVLKGYIERQKADWSSVID